MAFRRLLAGFLTACLLWPQPTWGMRVESPARSLAKAGLEEALAPPASPSIEVVHPDRLQVLDLRGVVFDFDDTLWTGFPRDLEAREWAKWMTGHESPSNAEVASWQGFLIRTAGLSGKDRFARLPSIPSDGEAFIERTRALLRTEVYRGRLTPAFLVRGALEFLSALRARDVQLAIASGGSKELRQEYADKLGIGSFFSAVHGDGAKAEAITSQMQAWQLQPYQMAMIGDGGPDMAAARAAGVLAVGFAPTPEYRQRLIDDGADVIIRGDYRQLDTILQVLKVPTPQVGLEEDPLLAIWQAQPDRPGLPNPLLKPLLERWSELTPWLQRHLADPQSPIPEWALWGALENVAWDAQWRRTDPAQWLWLVDVLLMRWDDQTADRPTRRLELKLLSRLDLAMLHWLAREEAGTARWSEALRQRHLTTVKKWHRRMPHDPHGMHADFAVALLRSLAAADTIPAPRRDVVWPAQMVRRSYRLIQRAWSTHGTSVWEASYLAPGHLRHLATLPVARQEALLDAALPLLLFRSNPGYDSMAGQSHLIF